MREILCIKFHKTAFARHLNKRFSIKEGETLTLECELLNQDHEVVWLKNDKRIYTGGKFQIDRRCPLLELVIKEPVKFDEAVYSCTLKHDQSRRSSTTLEIDTSTLYYSAYTFSLNPLDTIPF